MCLFSFHRNTNKLITRKINVRYLFLLIVCLFVHSDKVFAQRWKKKQLENKKKSLLKEIAYTNQLLSETKNNKRISLYQLVSLNKKISAREELIETINYEINLLENQINITNDSIQSLTASLQKLKDEYAKMIYFAWKNQDTYSKMMYIFASKDFNQAYMRLKYLQQYSEYRHTQALMIEQTELELNEKVQDITSEKTEQEQVFGVLEQKEKQLKKDLVKKQEDANKLQKAIQKIIEDEIEREKARAKREHNTSHKGLELTPEAQKLSNSFASNKGKLPWPVVKGIIVSTYGVHPHPLLKGVTISNNGIDIATTKGALARAVFDGEVTAVGDIPAAGQFIIIRHGEYLTVYANLKEVFVKTGDKVKTKQSIGTIIYDDSDSKTELHFELWKGQTRMDPSNWIYDASGN